MSELASPLRLNLEYVPLDALRNYDRNARTNSPSQIAKLIDAISTFGFLVPVLISATNDVIAGHARIAAARQLQMAEVPAVSVEHLNDAETRALRILDNRIAELASWDNDLLAFEFGELLELDLKHDFFALSLTGFDFAEIDQLISADANAHGSDDVAPEP
ncbi:MAG: ParB/Srx family N-terminal domain-containing protein, partial [Pseudomonadota bacterium]